MPFNGSGVFTPPAADFPAVSGTLILATHFNNVQNDVATGLSDCVTRDGQSAATANLPMGGFRHTGVSDGTARNQYSSLGQAQDSTVLWGGTAGGTADALTFALTPAITAYVAGQKFYFKSSSSPNATTTPTLAINGLAAKTIQSGGAALIAGDISADRWYSVLYTGTNFELDLVNSNSFVDSVFRITGSVDTTKQFRFEADGIATGTLRVITIPDADITLANWSTGDVKITLKTVADSGWVLMNDGSIGNAASGGTTRANADTSALFTLLWNNTVNADCAVSGGRGGSAAADFAANKNIALPKALGRAIACFGAGSGLTSRTLAKIFGEENHQLTLAELASHTHTAGTSAGVAAGGSPVRDTAAGSVATGSAGSDSPHNTMQPTVFMNVMIKL